MNLRTGLILLAVVGAIVGLILFTRPPAEAVVTTGSELPIPAILPNNNPQPTANIIASPSPVMLITATNSGPSQPDLPPSTTPQAFSAQQLQTFVPPSTVSPDDGTATALAPVWHPPGLSVPIARNPWDHYWFVRPVSANYNNEGLGYYPYGSNGDLDDLRIHHGVDFPNPVGVEIHAAADGVVIWADKGHFNEFESITAYGNCVVVQHDFGYNGEPMYTLYAHMSAIIATVGQRVTTGDVIGLIGATGQVTGPHVHFEVRVGRDSYFAVRNPMLWVAPYVDSGTVAGQITFANRRLVNDASLVLINRETGRVIQRTTSYAGFGAVADDNWKENFLFADVPAGKYIVTSRLENTTWYGEVEVLPGTTNWVALERTTPDVAPLIPLPTP